MDGRNGLSGPSSTGVGGAPSKSIIPAPSMSFTSPPPPGRPTTCQKERPKPTPATPKKKSSAHPHIRGVKSCPGLCPAASQAALQAERKRPTKTQSPVQLQASNTPTRQSPNAPHLASRPTGRLVHIHILKRERERKQDLPDLPVSAPRNTTNNHVQKHAPRLSSLVPLPSSLPCPMSYSSHAPVCPLAHVPIFAISVLRGRQHGVAALPCVRIAPQSTLFVIADLPACTLVHSPAVRPY